MSSFSIYILVVATSVLFIFSSSSSSSRPTYDEEPQYSVDLIRDEERMIKAKVQRDLRNIRMGRNPLQFSPVLNKSEKMTENKLNMVEENQQVSLTEAADSFNRKCREIEALLKEK